MLGGGESGWEARGMPLTLARIHHFSSSHVQGNGHPISIWLFLVIFVAVVALIGGMWLWLGGNAGVSKSITFGGSSRR